MKYVMNCIQNLINLQKILVILGMTYILNVKIFNIEKLNVHIKSFIFYYINHLM
jgi:hypothetical protein